MEIIIKCTNCPKAYRVHEDLIHQIYATGLPCTGCGDMIPLDPFVLDNEELRYFSSGKALKEEVVSNLKKLYPMPHVLFKARSLLTGHGNFRELEEILNTDPALAGRILKVANSAHYGMSGKVSSLQMAATVLGRDTLLQIITLVGQSKMLGQSLAGYGINAGNLWRHCLSVATCSQLIAETIGSDMCEEAFFAGLMHDSGKIILDSYVLERRHVFKRFIKLTQASITTAEEKILGLTHTDIGCELCHKWNLPNTMAAAIKHHHTPAHSGNNRLAYILNLADHMARAIAGVKTKPSSTLNETLEYLLITKADLKNLLLNARKSIETLEEATY